MGLRLSRPGAMRDPRALFQMSEPPSDSLWAVSEAKAGHRLRSAALAPRNRIRTHRTASGRDQQSTSQGVGHRAPCHSDLVLVRLRRASVRACGIRCSPGKVWRRFSFRAAVVRPHDQLCRPQLRASSPLRPQDLPSRPPPPEPDAGPCGGRSKPRGIGSPLPGRAGHKPHTNDGCGGTRPCR